MLEDGMWIIKWFKSSLIFDGCWKTNRPIRAGKIQNAEVIFLHVSQKTRHETVQMLSTKINSAEVTSSRQNCVNHTWLVKTQFSDWLQNKSCPAISCSMFGIWCLMELNTEIIPLTSSTSSCGGSHSRNYTVLDNANVR